MDGAIAATRRRATIRAIIGGIAVAIIAFLFILHKAIPTGVLFAFHRAAISAVLVAVVADFVERVSSLDIITQHAIVADGDGAAVETVIGVLVVAVVAFLKIGGVVGEIGAQNAVAATRSKAVGGAGIVIDAVAIIAFLGALAAER